MISKALTSSVRFPVSRSRRIATYLRLKAKLKAGLGKGGGESEALFGYKMSVGDYPSFVGVYEEIFMGLEYHFSCATSRPLIVDAGTNIGVSALFFKTLFPDARLLCFESNPDTYRLLDANLRANNVSYCRSFNVALGADSGSLVPVYSDSPASLRSSVHRDRAESSVQSGSTTTARLSDFLSEPVALLKLDVEGSEHAVAADLVNTGKWSLVDQALIEYHHHAGSQPDRLGEFLGTLEQQGFRYQIHASHRPPFRRAAYQDILIYAYRTASTAAGNEA